MLDPHFQISIQLPQTVPKVDGLKIESCIVHYLADDRLWSQFDEMIYNRQNRNDFGFGALDIEIGLSGFKRKSYPEVYTKCFLLRTDNDLLIRPMKTTNNKSLSKINKQGELAIGIRYYFQSDEEVKKLTASKQIMFEFFAALGNSRNTYAFMCQLAKCEESWEIQMANTYRLRDKDNIKTLMD